MGPAKYYFNDAPAPGHVRSAPADGMRGDAGRSDEAAGDAKAHMAMTGAVTWVVTDGKIGMVSQAMGLAERVGFDIVQKTVRPAMPWRWLPPMLWAGRASGIGRGSDRFDEPLPDLLISCGRHAIGPALSVKVLSKGRTFLVHAQHPRLNPAHFDLVAAPRHDGLQGANVMPVTGSLHGITDEKLAAAAERFAPKLDHLPRPLVAVSVGGDNSVYRLTDAVVDTLADGLERLARAHGAGLAITPSRRTGAAATARLRERLRGIPVEIWDGSGDNPYLGYLALADAIVVTCDSVNMISEACATGKPVYLAGLEGGRNSKFAAFHHMLTEAGITRPFDGSLAHWQYAPLDDTARIAAEIRRRMGRSG